MVGQDLGEYMIIGYLDPRGRGEGGGGRWASGSVPVLSFGILQRVGKTFRGDRSSLGFAADGLAHMV